MKASEVKTVDDISPNNICPKCKARFFSDIIVHFCPNCGSDDIFIALARIAIKKFDR